MAMARIMGIKAVSWTLAVLSLAGVGCTAVFGAHEPPPSHAAREASEACLAARDQLSMLLLRAQGPDLRAPALSPGPGLLDEAAFLDRAPGPRPRREQRPIDAEVIEAIGRVRAACADAPPIASPIPLEELATPASAMP
jgi:hypothetical protein